MTSVYHCHHPTTTWELMPSLWDHKPVPPSGSQGGTDLDSSCSKNASFQARGGPKAMESVFVLYSSPGNLWRLKFCNILPGTYFRVSDLGSQDRFWRDSYNSCFSCCCARDMEGTAGGRGSLRFWLSLLVDKDQQPGFSGLTQVE